MRSITCYLYIVQWHSKPWYSNEQFDCCTGGLTGAGARITGAFGDVFAKLTFDDEFIDRRQQEKVQSTKLGSKAFGFLKVSLHVHIHTHNTEIPCKSMFVLV